MSMTSVRATAEERRRPFPGDDLLHEPIASWTHGVSISAPPGEVWPWLAQMGAGRAGWYSWDRLDNGGRRSAEELLPGLGRVHVGEVLPAGPGVTGAFVVERVEAGRDLVLTVPDGSGGPRVSWEFLLDPAPGQRTRLLVRARVAARGWMAPIGGELSAGDRVGKVLGKLPRRPVLALARGVHRVMEARQLRGIQRRVVARHESAAAAAMVAEPGLTEGTRARRSLISRLSRADNGMNVVGQGARIMLVTAPFVVAAMLLQARAPGLARIPVIPGVARPLGVALLLAGALFWGTAVAQLVTGFARGTLVTSGAYAACRNPIYASFALLVLPGLTLATGTWGWLLPSVALLVAVRAFIGREERDLLRVFGDEYRRYTERVHRVIPFLRPSGRSQMGSAHAAPGAKGGEAAALRRRGGGSPGTRAAVIGQVAPGFEGVRDAFLENFIRRGELGGAVSVWLDGEPVVDLWGGIRNRETGEPWERDTMVLVYSATKGLSAMALAVAHSRGLLDYEERVATYWPEFARNGKERITVRQLLAHQAGLFAFDEKVDREVVADLDRLAAVMERQRPAWQPGTKQAYHVITLGFYEGELLRRVDPLHRTLGQFFQDEIATPLGIDFYVRLPESIPDSRLARLELANPLALLRGYPFLFALTVLNPRSIAFRAAAVNPGTELPRDPEHVYVRNLEVPSGGGVGTARAIARSYGVFATGGKELGLRRETLGALEAPAVPAAKGFHDYCVKGSVKFALGFMKPSEAWPFGSSDAAYGSPGSGGSLGFADPALGLGYGYVTSQSGTTLTADPRELALREAVYSAVRRRG